MKIYSQNLATLLHLELMRDEQNFRASQSQGQWHQWK